MPVPQGKKGVEKVMREYKAGKLHSGKNGKTVKSRKQAVAIALSSSGQSKKKAGKIAVPKRGSVTTKKRTMKQAEAQRRGMAATRARQQKGRLTAEERRKVTQREKEREQDRRGRVTTQRFLESF